MTWRKLCSGLNRFCTWKNTEAPGLWALWWNHSRRGGAETAEQIGRGTLSSSITHAKLVCQTCQPIVSKDRLINVMNVSVMYSENRDAHDLRHYYFFTGQTCHCVSTETTTGYEPCSLNQLNLFRRVSDLVAQGLPLTALPTGLFF